MEEDNEIFILTSQSDCFSFTPSISTTTSELTDSIDINEISDAVATSSVEMNKGTKSVSISDLIGYRPKKEVVRIDSTLADDPIEEEHIFVSDGSAGDQHETREEPIKIRDLSKKHSLLSILSGNMKKKNQDERSEKKVEKKVDTQIKKSKKHIKKIKAQTNSETDPMLIDDSTERSFIVRLKLPDPAMRKLKELEEKIYNDSVKKVSAKDLFKTLNTKKLSSDVVVIEENDPSLIVTLPIAKEKLKEIQEISSNPFFTRGNLLKRNESLTELGSNKGGSFLKSMVDRSISSTPRSTPLQKLKELAPPILTRDQFHVIPPVKDYTEHRYIDILHRFSIRDEKVYMSDLSKLSRFFVEEKPKFKYQSNHRDSYYITTLIETKITNVYSDPRLTKLLSLFNTHETQNQLWCNYFKPTKTGELLIPNGISYKLNRWMISSFKRLERATGPRFKKTKKRDEDDEMDDFIVDDYELEEDLTEEEIFVPIMILYGPPGSCKSTSVYAAAEEIDGYVYEINSGQPRGRKDILTNLKELSTTHLVHQKNNTRNDKSFQKGIILFEDVDVLFEQDKSFWSVIHEILNISRRPLVLTTSSIDVIPTDLLEYAQAEHALIEMTRPDINILKDYLWLICLSKGFDVQTEIIDELILDNGRDVRKCLIELQFLCQNMNCHVVVLDDNDNETSNRDISKEITSIEYNDTKPDEWNKESSQSLETLANRYDYKSCSDIISYNSKSSLNHEADLNELVDTYIIDESSLLKQHTLPFEVNVGGYMKSKLNHHDIPTESIITTHEIRSKIRQFYEAKLRRPAVIRRTRISNFASIFNDTIPLKDNSSFFILPSTALVTDLAPYVRSIANHEVAISQFQQENNSEIDDTSNTFIVKPRRFDIDPGIALSTFC